MIPKDALTAGLTYFTVVDPGGERFNFLVAIQPKGKKSHPSWKIKWLPEFKDMYQNLGVVHQNGTVSLAKTAKTEAVKSAFEVAKLAVRHIWDGKDDPTDYSIQFGDEDNPACPICGKPLSLDYCKHAILTWTYDTERGHWTSSSRKLTRLRHLVTQLLDGMKNRLSLHQIAFIKALLGGASFSFFTKGTAERLRQLVSPLRGIHFSDSQLGFLRRLSRLPSRLVIPISRSVEADEFSCENWDKYLQTLLRKSPGFAGIAVKTDAIFDDEDDFLEDIASSYYNWVTAWSGEKKKCGKWVKEQLDRDLRLLAAVTKTTARSRTLEFDLEINTHINDHKRDISVAKHVKHDESPDSLDQINNFPCPICGTPISEGPCEHSISAWKYGDGGGHWPGSSRKPTQIRVLVNRLLKLLTRRFTEHQFDFLLRLLECAGGKDCALKQPNPARYTIDEALRLRKLIDHLCKTHFSDSQLNFLEWLLRLHEQLLIPLIKSIQASCFVSEYWEEFLLGLLKDYPERQGFAWTHFWAEDRKKCGDYLDAQIDCAIEFLEESCRVAKRISTIGM